MLDWTRPRPAITVAHLVTLGESLDIPAERLLAGTDLTVADLADLGRSVLGLDEVAVVRSLLREAPRHEYLGLASAAHSHTTSYGPLGFAWASAPTMGVVYDTGRRFHSLTFGMTDVDFTVTDGWFSMNFIPQTLPNDVLAFYLQREIALPMVIAHELSEVAIRARGTLTQGPFTDPDAHALAEKIFGSAPRFNAEVAAFSMPLDFLELPLPRNNPHTHAQMCELAEVEMQQVLASNKVAETVRHTVRETLAQGARLEDVAHRMLVSPRTLRRQLQEEGTSFRMIVDSVRVSRAEYMLSQPTFTVSQVAAALGYENPPAFTTAFKRWHGMTPSQFRTARASHVA